MQGKKLTRWFQSNRFCQYLNRRIYRELFQLLIGSLVISIGVFFAIFYICRSTGCFRQKHVGYDNDRVKVNNRIIELVEDIYQKEDSDNFDEYLKDSIRNMEGTVYLTDEQGMVLEASDETDTIVKQISIEDWKEKTVNEAGKEKLVGIYPMFINASKSYILYDVKLSPTYIYTDEIIIIVSILAAALIYFTIVFFGIRRKVQYIKYLGEAAKEVSRGNLDLTVKQQGSDELSRIAENMNRMEQNLKQRIQTERRQYEEQQELITNMSHDLKTPITVLLGYLDILRTHQYKEESESQNYLEISYNKAESLRDMVLKLFELTKSNQEQKLTLSEVNLSRLLRQIVMEQEPLVEEKQVRIDLELPEETVLAKLDIEKISGAFNNLMNNAVKYVTKGGRIHIRLKKMKDEILLDFINTSNPLGEQELVDIFKKFYRGDKARNSAIEGNGIGLAIVKNIVEMHNGVIYADYQDGEIDFHMRFRT